MQAGLHIGEKEYKDLSSHTTGMTLKQRKRGGNSAQQSSNLREQRKSDISKIQADAVEQSKSPSTAKPIDGKVTQEPPVAQISLVESLKALFPATLSCLGTPQEAAFNLEQDVLRQKLLEELGEKKADSSGDASGRIAELEEKVEKDRRLIELFRKKIERLEAQHGKASSSEPIEQPSATDPFGQIPSGEEILGDQCRSLERRLSEAREVAAQAALMAQKLLPESDHPELVTPHDVRQTIATLNRQTEQLGLILGLDIPASEDLSMSMIKTERHIQLIEIITKVQEKLGALTSNLTAAVETQPKVEDTEQAKTLLVKHYTPCFTALEQLCKDYLMLKELFDKYVGELQAKIMTDEQMAFKIPEVHLKTTSYVLESATAVEIQKKLESAEERYKRRYDRLRELLLKRMNIEEKLNSAAHTIYSKIMGTGESEFIKQVEGSLALIRTNVNNPQAIEVESLRDWFLIRTLSKEILAVKSFTAMASDSRHIIREMAKSSAPMKPVQIEMCYKTLKTEYQELARRAESLLALMQDVQTTLQRRVEEWERDPRISDYNLQRQAIVRGMTEEALKKQEYEPFLEAHFERKQLLAKVNSEMESYAASFGLAHKEVNRLYDSIQRGGVFITETRYNLSGHVDPEVLLPKAQAIMRQATAKPDLTPSALTSSSQQPQSSMHNSSLSDDSTEEIPGGSDLTASVLHGNADASESKERTDSKQ